MWLRDLDTESLQAARPFFGVSLLCFRHLDEDLTSSRILLVIGEDAIGTGTLRFRLPILPQCLDQAPVGRLRGEDGVAVVSVCHRSKSNSDSMGS